MKNCGKKREGFCVLFVGQSSLFLNYIFSTLAHIYIVYSIFCIFFPSFFTLTPVVYQFVGKMGCLWLLLIGWVDVSLLLGLRKQATPKLNCIISGVNL